MSKFIPADNGGSNTYDLGAALKSAVQGTKITGYTAEVSQELAKRHGDEGLRIPLQAIMTAKATGASGLIGGAVPLQGFSLEPAIVAIDNAIGKELLATKAGVSTRTTDASEFRVPYTDQRPSAQIVDVDQALTPGTDANFDFVSVRPVIAGSIIEVGNSIDWTNPDALQVITSQISSVVTETIDAAFISGFGPTGTGVSFGGLTTLATNSGAVLSTTSNIASWAAVTEVYGAYTERTDYPGTAWLLHPRVCDEVLTTSAVFAGATSAIGAAGGFSTLLGKPIVRGRVPVTAGAPDTCQAFFGDFNEVFLVLFNSASISLTANPYETASFARGSTKLRIMVSFGMGVRDPKRIIRATVQL